MADWSKLTRRGNVEDRRGMRMIGGLGGVSVTGIALLLLINILAGGSPVDVLNQLIATAPSTEQIDTGEFAGQDTYEVFASAVLGSANEAWASMFSKRNRTFTEPTLVLFRDVTQSGCGIASAQVGPFYCPEDETIYLDETFFDELTRRFGARGGDVAEAYVIAHEVGHHAQNMLGIMDQIQTQSDPRDENAASIKIELQADCFAGLWAYSLKDRGIFDPNEIFEAMDAAAAVGDDRIQERTQGHVSPDTWTHGSSAERQAWFTKGYENGTVEACDTFR